jgi:hypothetical protein
MRRGHHVGPRHVQARVDRERRSIYGPIAFDYDAVLIHQQADPRLERARSASQRGLPRSGPAVPDRER